MKTLVLGPKTMRLKHLFTTGTPDAVAQSSLAVRNLFWLARWTGRISVLLLLAVIVATTLRANRI